MLLTEEEDSPLKAIDFGLAVFFDPDKLPRTDLGLEGTPWFMAPETLSSQTYPASDIWAAGIMAYQACHSRGSAGQNKQKQRGVVCVDRATFPVGQHGIRRAWHQGQGLGYAGFGHS